jgi:hypothetical protein
MARLGSTVEMPNMGLLRLLLVVDSLEIALTPSL